MLQLLGLARENAALTRELILSREKDATLRELLAAIHETWTGRGLDALLRAMPISSGIGKEYG